MKEGMKFIDNVTYKHYNKEGKLLEEITTHNTTNESALLAVREFLKDDTGDAIDRMAISVDDTPDGGLSAETSFETPANSNVDSDAVKCSATFTGVAASISSAGLGHTDLTVDGNLYFYDDSVNVDLTADDSLQIDWTITVA